MKTDNNIGFGHLYKLLGRSPFGRPLYAFLATIQSIILLTLLTDLAFACIVAAIALVLYALIIGVITLAMFLRYRNKFQEIPICYKVDAKTIKITYGDRSSHHTYTAILKKENVRNVWQRGLTIYVRRTWLTRVIVLPRKKRREFLSALHEYGWFDLSRHTERRKILFQLGGLAACAFITLGVATAFYDAPLPAPNMTVSKPKAAVKSEDVIKALNSKRTARGKAPLITDQNLITSSAQACKDMETNRYFGEQNPVTGQNGFEYMHQYYADRWIVQVSLAVNDGFSAEQIALRWAESENTTNTALDERYTMGAVAMCRHTVNDNFDTIVVLHLAS